MDKKKLLNEQLSFDIQKQTWKAESREKRQIQKYRQLHYSLHYDKIKQKHFWFWHFQMVPKKCEITINIMFFQTFPSVSGVLADEQLSVWSSTFVFINLYSSSMFSKIYYFVHRKCFIHVQNVHSLSSIGSSLYTTVKHYRSITIFSFRKHLFRGRNMRMYTR